MRPGEENLDGPPIHGNTRLEVVWTVIPAVLILGLCTYAYFVLDDIERFSMPTPVTALRHGVEVHAARLAVAQTEGHVSVGGSVTFRIHAPS